MSITRWYHRGGENFFRNTKGIDIVAHRGLPLYVKLFCSGREKRTGVSRLFTISRAENYVAAREKWLTRGLLISRSDRIERRCFVKRDSRNDRDLSLCHKKKKKKTDGLDGAAENAVCVYAHVSLACHKVINKRHPVTGITRLIYGQRRRGRSVQTCLRRVLVLGPNTPDIQYFLIKKKILRYISNIFSNIFIIYPPINLANISNIPQCISVKRFNATISKIETRGRVVVRPIDGNNRRLCMSSLL